MSYRLPESCPNCGIDLKRQQRVVEQDGWRIGHRWAEHDGVSIDLTPAEAMLVHTLASSPNVDYKAEALVSRVSPSGSLGSVYELVARVRRKLPDVPIVTNHWHKSYRWEAS